MAAPMPAVRRAHNELNMLRVDPLKHASIYPLTRDLLLWQADVMGPKGSPYVGGVFSLKITLGAAYPNKPPTVLFQTKIYHPNITDAGKICLKILDSDWSPSITLKMIVQQAIDILREPVVVDPMIPAIANEYTAQRQVYWDKAARMAREYAM